MRIIKEIEIFNEQKRKNVIHYFNVSIKGSRTHGTHIIEGPKALKTLDPDLFIGSVRLNGLGRETVAPLCTSVFWSTGK